MAIWEMKTQEEINAEGPILLTPRQYVGQLSLWSYGWFLKSENKSGRIVLVSNSIKWGLAYISPDNSFVRLEKGGKSRKVTAEELVNNYMFDHCA